MTKTLVILLLILVGCQTSPTRVSEVDENQETRAFQAVQFGKSWDLQKSIIIDTRSRFDFEMSKTPRSFHIFWKDWGLDGYHGVQLEKRKVELQRRLARKGVDPYSSVVIFGSGLAGDGEELLVAATLFRLGVRKIAIVPPSKLKKSLVTKDIKPIASLPYWERKLSENWSCGNKKRRPQMVSSQDFTSDLQLKNKKKFPGGSAFLKSQKGFWAYGAAFHLMKKGRQACIVE